MTKIKYIIFDLDQTIVNHLRGEKKGLEWIYAAFLKENVRSFQQLHDDFTRINTALWIDLEKGEYDAAFIIDNRFKYLTQLYAVDEKVEIIQKAYTDRYIDHSIPFKGAVALLEELSTMGIPLGIGSNGFIGCQTRKLDRHRLKQYFSKYYYGNRAPFCKPHQHFFRSITKDLELRAEEILFIGDSEGNDIVPAVAFGMKTLHINQDYLVGDCLDHKKILARINEIIHGN